ncbi:ribosome biogenesis protein Nop53/GLTSCR2 [Flagelloscypha sp. PMI_526]|nr:ribosome biogenesis protein Nop53/GLTSCR2 [Flagelloscypha sp. PMI_526]
MPKAAKPTQAKDGGPSQFKQGSRKGKRAWRKNIDNQAVEDGLEDIREEERLTGKPLHKQEDKDLFYFDQAGDEEVRKHVPLPLAKPPKRPLKSTEILSKRSAVPAVFSRPPKSTKVTKEDKERLSRIAKRGVRGPFNSVMDPSELGNGSATLEVSSAVKESGGYDLWNRPAVDPSASVPEGLEKLQKRKPQAPKLDAHPRSTINAAAVSAPHQGTSYNPAVDAYQSLLLEAHEKEIERVKSEEELEAFKQKMLLARQGTWEGPGPSGMIIPEIVEDDEDVVEEESFTKPAPGRKTKQQRQKAARRLAEKREQLEKLNRKRLLASVNEARSLRKKANKVRMAQQEVAQARQAALVEKLRNGLQGQRLGKHKVPEGAIDVQLGEDLSESLRALKPEGNLFRDRFLSMQQRALIEPRVRVLPRKRVKKIKIVESHVWKRFT